MNLDDAFHYFKDMYIKPWTRCAPYLVGMLFGYAMYTAKKRNYKLNKVLN